MGWHYSFCLSAQQSSPCLCFIRCHADNLRTGCKGWVFTSILCYYYMQIFSLGNTVNRKSDSEI